MMEYEGKNIAVKRIHTLFELANKKIHQDEILAQRYASLARKVAMTARIHLPKKYRFQILLKPNL